MKCNRCQNEDPKLFAYDHGSIIVVSALIFLDWRLMKK